MVNAPRVKNIERLADVGGRPFFPRVRDRQEPGRPGPRENAFELRRRVSRLGGVEAYPEDPLPERERLLERPSRVLGRQVAEKAENEPRRDPEAGFSVGERAVDPFDDGR